MPAVDQVVERVRGSRLVAAAFDLAEAYVVNDQQFGACPALETLSVGAIGETGVQIIEQVDTTGVEHADALLAGAQDERLEDVALAGTVVAGDHQVVVPAHEVEAGELENQRLVEAGLKRPVECLERFALGQAAGGDASCDALLELVGDLDAEDVLEELRGTWALLGGPGEPLVELGEGDRQSEELEVFSESGDDRVVSGGVVSWLGSGSVGSLGHAKVSLRGDRTDEVIGRRS